MKTSGGVDAYLRAAVRVSLGTLVYIIARCSILGQSVPAGTCAVEATGSVDTQFRAVVGSCSALVNILAVVSAVKARAVALVADTVIH